jgi:hypothetical protein
MGRNITSFSRRQVPQREERPPRPWEKELLRLRETAEYRAILDEYEPLIRKLEADVDIEALLRLIQKATDGKLPS